MMARVETFCKEKPFRASMQIMKTREETLRRMLAEMGSVTLKVLPRPTRQELQPVADEVLGVYGALGGAGSQFPARPGHWDIEYDGIAVELDEQLHFNRYRAITLSSAIYLKIPYFPHSNYQEYCKNFEFECLQAGKAPIGKWTNPSCERQFGVSAAPGELSDAGSARWRQRAFYDFLKDLSPIILNLPVARVAIWDVLEIEGRKRTVEWILRNAPQQGAAAISNLIKSRCGSN